MRTSLRLHLVLAIASLLASGAAAAPLRVVATTPDLADLARSVGGDAVPRRAQRIEAARRSDGGRTHPGFILQLHARSFAGAVLVADAGRPARPEAVERLHVDAVVAQHLVRQKDVGAARVDEWVWVAAEKVG